MPSAFQRFIIKNENNINQIADRLGVFKIDSVQIGFNEAKARVTSWIENFDKVGFKNFDNVLYLLHKMDFIESSVIADKLGWISKEYLRSGDAFIAPLGENSESSFRIAANFNRHGRFFPSFEELINSIPESENNKIILYDDFLNSGGQIVTIFKSLLGLGFQVGEINDEGSKRLRLNERQKKKLLRSEVHLFYYKAFDDGAEYIDIKNDEELKLKLKIHRYTPANKTDGLFGDSDDEAAIANNLHHYISHGVFRGNNSSEITPFYKILKDVGLALIHANEPGWGIQKKVQRSLGYGNDARIIITDFNVPTNTITCLWMSGTFTFNGNTIEWNALLPRRKKVINYPKRSVSSLDKERKKIPFVPAYDQLTGLSTFTIEQLERWEGISLSNLLKNWTADDLDNSKSAARVLFNSVTKSKAFILSSKWFLSKC